MRNFTIKNYKENEMNLLSGKSDKEVVSEVLLEDGVVGEVVGERIAFEVKYLPQVMDGAITRELIRSSSKDVALNKIREWFEAEDNLIKKLSINEEELKAFSEEIGVDIPYTLYVGVDQFTDVVFDLMTNVHKVKSLEKDILEVQEFIKSSQYDSLPKLIQDRVVRSMEEDIEKMDYLKLEYQPLLEKMNEKIAFSNRIKDHL